MKWEKAKTILIVFFIIINLFLLTYIAADKVQSKRIEKLVTDSVIELMVKNGINIDRNLVTEISEPKTMKTIYVRNIVSGYEEFAKKVLGKDILSDNEKKYENNNGSICFGGDYFEAKALQGKYLKEISVSRNSAEKIAEEYIASIGVDTRGLKGELTEKNGDYYISFDKNISGRRVFGVGITVISDNYGIKELCGSWFNEEEGINTEMELKKVSGVLIEYMNNKKGSNAVVDSISLGYATLEAMLYHETVVLIPVWEITDKSGDSIYIDAREN